VLIASVALWLAIQMGYPGAGGRAGKFSAWLYVLLGASTLVRVDMAALSLVIIVFMTVTDSRNRWRHLGWGLGLLAFFIGGQTILRYLYYGDLLPNTYYLKMTGYPTILRILRGYYIFLLFAWRFNWVLLLSPLVVLLIRWNLAKGNPDGKERLVANGYRASILLMLAFMVQVAYSIYVGADAWEHQGGANRYISITIPAFFILFADILDRIYQAVINKLTHLPRRQGIAAWSLALLFVLSYLNFNTLLGFESWKRLALVDPPLFSASGLQYVRQSLVIERITTKEASIAMIPAGAIPYFTDRYSIDLFGKSERHIAHGEARIGQEWYTFYNFRPGHIKWDYEYVLAELKPDVILNIYGDTTYIKPVLDAEYIYVEIDKDHYYIRLDSPNILWDAVPAGP
jgi:hypothetical protein